MVERGRWGNEVPGLRSRSAATAAARNHLRQSAQIRAQLNLITVLSGLVCHRKPGPRNLL